MARSIKEGKSVRLKQRESVLLHAVGDIFVHLQKEIKELVYVFPNRIDLSADGSLAKIYLYSTNGSDFVSRIVGQLIFYRSSIRKSIGSMVAFRVVPEILFLYDNAYEKEQKLQHFIDKVRENDKNLEESLKKDEST